MVDKKRIFLYSLLVFLCAINAFLIIQVTYENRSLAEEVEAYKYVVNKDEMGAPGYYYPDSKMILLDLEGTHAVTAQLYANHEIGHYIWHELLTEDQKAEYIDLYNTTDYYMTEYSKKNVREDFADSFSLFMRNKLNGSRETFFLNYVDEKVYTYE